MNLPYSDDLNISALSRVFRHTTNSYKLYWFDSLLREIQHGHHVIRFRDVVLGMIVRSWYPLLEYRLNLGTQDKLDELVRFVYQKYQFDKHESPEILRRKLEKLDDPELSDKVKYFYRYVPYRLLSTFFSEKIRGIKDHKKNKRIIELAANTNQGIYSFEKGENKLHVRKEWFKYLTENQRIVQGWIHKHLVDYLQDRNPNVPAIPRKLERLQRESLTRERTFWKRCLENGATSVDLYTDDIRLDTQNTDLDHFLPFSFVRHNRVWNLIPTISEINQYGKRDHLPRKERYFDAYCERQYQAYSIGVRHSFNKNLLEQYLDLGHPVDLEVPIPKPTFTQLLKNTLDPLYQIALNHGYEVWEHEK